MVVLYTAAQDVPEVFYGRHIRGVGRSLHALDVLMPEEVGDDSCSMGCSVVVLQDGSHTHGLQSRDGNGPQDLIPVADPGQVALDEVELGPAS